MGDVANFAGSQNRDYSIPNIILKSALLNNSGLNVCHVNIRSLFGKLDCIRSALRGSGVHILMISESWLNSDITDAMIRIPGYKVFRNDRASRGGGVMIYVKCGLSLKILDKSCDSDGIEFIMAGLKSKNSEVLLCCAYFPNPSAGRLKPFEVALRRFSSRYGDVIIGGDFNIDVLGPSSGVLHAFRMMLETLSLFILNDIYPTRFGVSRNGLTSSLLDFWIVPVACALSCSTFGQLSLPGSSDHDLLYLNYNISVPKSASESFTYRDFRHCNTNNLLQDACNFRWDDICVLSGSISRFLFLTLM